MCPAGPAVAKPLYIGTLYICIVSEFVDMKGYSKSLLSQGGFRTLHDILYILSLLSRGGRKGLEPSMTLLSLLSRGGEEGLTKVTGPPLLTLDSSPPSPGNIPRVPRSTPDRASIFHYTSAHLFLVGTGGGFSWLLLGGSESPLTIVRYSCGDGDLNFSSSSPRSMLRAVTSPTSSFPSFESFEGDFLEPPVCSLIATSM